MAGTASDLWAENAIRDVQRRYCRGVDRLDFAMIRACFHADADLDYGKAIDVDALLKMAEERLAAYSSTTHFIGNQLVELDGDSAWAEHYVIAYHRVPANWGDPEHDFICNFRYVDRMEWRHDEGWDGGWRIARRVLLVDSWRRVPLADLGPGPAQKPGRRDREDLSWSDKFRRKGA